MVVSLTGAVAS